MPYRSGRPRSAEGDSPRRSRPTMPIDIPGHRPPSAPPTSPIERSKSPEMIFEMSPISPAFSSGIHQFQFPISTSTFHATNKYDPFTYSIPTFKPFRHEHGGEFSPPRSPDKVMPSRVRPARPTGRGTDDAHPVSDEQDIPYDAEWDSDDCITRTQPTTKIDGFSPLFGHPSPMLDEVIEPLGRLSPSPRRRSSYSSSPWILGGKSDYEETSVAYSQADPSAFEFRRHLLSRIENQEYSRQER